MTLSIRYWSSIQTGLLITNFGGIAILEKQKNNGKVFESSQAFIFMMFR
jgi:hypothetical protein